MWKAVSPSGGLGPCGLAGVWIPWPLEAPCEPRGNRLPHPPGAHHRSGARSSRRSRHSALWSTSRGVRRPGSSAPTPARPGRSGRSRARPRAARAAAWNCSPTIFGESGTTRSSGAGLTAARSVRTAPATAPFTNRTSLVSPSWFVFPRRTVTSTPSPSAASSTSASDSRPRPRRRGWWQVARTAARSAAPDGGAGRRPDCRRSAGSRRLDHPGPAARTRHQPLRGRGLRGRRHVDRTAAVVTMDALAPTRPAACRARTGGPERITLILDAPHKASASSPPQRDR